MSLINEALRRADMAKRPAVKSSPAPTAPVATAPPQLRPSAAPRLVSAPAVAPRPNMAAPGPDLLELAMPSAAPGTVPATTPADDTGSTATPPAVKSALRSALLLATCTLAILAVINVVTAPAERTPAPAYAHMPGSHIADTTGLPPLASAPAEESPLELPSVMIGGQGASLARPVMFSPRVARILNSISHSPLWDETLPCLPAATPAPPALLAPAETPIPAATPQKAETAQQDPAPVAVIETQKPVEQVPPAEVIAEKEALAPALPPAVKAAPAQPELTPQNFKLGSILSAGQTGYALINGQMISVGDEIDGARVVAIGIRQVTLERDGKKLVLRF